MSKVQKPYPALKIDPEFESKIPPLTEEEFKQLEENIVSEGTVLMPLIVWDGTIIDGHNRYKIAQAHPDITFTIHEKDFENRYEALAWICNNQLGRRNLTPIQKKLLIGDRYKAEKMANGGDRKSAAVKSADQNDPLIFDHGTRSKIAMETHTSEGYVQRAEAFSSGVSAAEEVSPGFRQEVISGNIKPTQKEMQAAARASPDERESIIDQVFRRGRKSSATPRGRKERPSGASPASPPDSPTSEKTNTVTVESAVRQFEWEVTKVMQDFDITFDHWPQLIAEEAYRRQVVDALQDLKTYILHIEGGSRYEWDRESRKISL